MFRIIAPDDGHCLFFPGRDKDRRIVVGRRIWIVLWQEWIHVPLAQFDVQLPGTSESELFATAENLECQVRSNFKIVIGGEEVDKRAPRLTKAVALCSPTRSIRKRVEVSFFHGIAEDLCKRSVSNVINQRNYVELLEDADYRADTAKEIETELRDGLENIGLVLALSTIIIEPLEPKSSLASELILRRWLEFKRIEGSAELAKKKEANAAEIAEAREDDNKKKRLQEIETERQIDDKNLANFLQEEDRKLEIKEKEQNRAKDKAISELEKEMLGSNHKLQLFRLEMDTAYKEEMQRKRQELESQKYQMEAELEEESERRKQEFERRRFQMEAELEEEKQRKKQEIESRDLQFEEEVLGKRVQLLALQQEEVEKAREISRMRQEVSLLEIELKKIKGLAKAEVAEQRELASVAGAVRIKELVLSALPEILEQANRPLEKMGDIRSFNVTGSADSFGPDKTLGALLASAPLFPLIKEIFRFFSESELDLESWGRGSKGVGEAGEKE